ncbi:MAG: biopolymer transporter ExbD [Betaproteobacteria bacterium]
MLLSPVPADDEDAVLSQINTTPLVDVMLVLLIIFLITIPVVTTSVSLNLPRERTQERQARPDNIIISVDRAGRIYWYDTPVVAIEDLVTRLRKVAAATPQPEVQIRGDAAARYEGVGRVMAACQSAGIARVAFITEPAAQNR